MYARLKDVDSLSLAASGLCRGVQCYEKDKLSFPSCPLSSYGFLDPHFAVLEKLLWAHAHIAINTSAFRFKNVTCDLMLKTLILCSDILC